VSKVPALDRRYVQEAARHGVRARIFAAESSGDRAGPLTRRHGSPAAQEYLHHRLRDPEVVVHVEGHYLLGLVPERAQPTALLVEHNIESALFEQRAGLSRSPRECAVLLREGARTRRDEVWAWRRVRAVGGITEEDVDAIRAAVPSADVRLLPNGADHLRVDAVQLDAGQRGVARLLFVAALGYGPNLDAARLLVDDVFPDVLGRCPDATLAIVGSDPPAWLVEAARREPRLTVTGWVPDVSPWLDAAEVVICPLTVGGGVKVKVLEALTRGCAIVATPIALQGLRHLPDGAVIECVDPANLAEVCVRLLDSLCERARQRARATVAARQLPSWDLAADTLAGAWNDVAATATAGPAGARM
jgi:glycosyltransferase involved in cell wall biosynthesis